MQRDSDEDAWRAIVENYGDRVELDEGVQPGATAEPAADTGQETPSESGLQRLFRPLPQPEDVDDDLDDELDDGFVPDAPPPLPIPPPDRMLAWAGLFGSPTVLLVCLVFGFHLPPWLGYMLVAAFIGGFGYLVATMPRGEDVDPWDDGARL